MRARRSFVRPQGAANVDINVTPLIDVVLVLLIIFMVVTPLSEKEIAIKLPEVSEQPAGATPPEEQVVVGVTAEGRLTINSEPIGDEDYIPRLRRILAARPAGQRLLFFMPDGRARYARLVAALSGAKSAGAETLGMMPELPKPP